MNIIENLKIKIIEITKILKDEINRKFENKNKNNKKYALKEDIINSKI